MGMKNAYRIVVRNPEGRKSFRKPSIDVRIKEKLTLKKRGM
jgi:hypothetical protein